MHEAVGKPGKDVKDGVLMRGKDVAEIGTVQNVLERWQRSHPNRRPVLSRYELARVEEDEPAEDWQAWQNELPRERYYKARHEQCCQQRLHKGARTLHYR